MTKTAYDEWAAAADIGAIIILALAIPSIFPYSYYIILRWAVAGSSVYLCWYLWHFYRKDKSTLIILFLITAIIFNPFVPFYFSKETWVLIDLATIALLASSFFMKTKN